MTNPFEAIDARLSNIESLLIDIKHGGKSLAAQTVPTHGRVMSLPDVVAYTGKKELASEREAVLMELIYKMSDKTDADLTKLEIERLRASIDRINEKLDIVLKSINK